MEKAQLHKIKNDKGEITTLKEPSQMTKIYANEFEKLDKNNFLEIYHIYQK